MHTHAYIQGYKQLTYVCVITTHMYLDTYIISDCFTTIFIICIGTTSEQLHMYVEVLQYLTS